MTQPQVIPATYVRLDNDYDPACPRAKALIKGDDDMRVVTEKVVYHLNQSDKAIAKKQDKITTAKENDIATFDNAGNTKDSSKLFDTSSDFSAATDDQIKTALAIKNYITAITPSLVNNVLNSRFYIYIRAISMPALTASNNIVNIGSGTATIFGSLSISQNKITLATPQAAKRFLLDVTLNVTLAVGLASVTFTITGSNCTIVTQPRTLTLLGTQDIRLTAIITVPTSTTAAQFWIAISGIAGTVTINNQSSLILTEI